MRVGVVLIFGVVLAVVLMAYGMWLDSRLASVENKISELSTAFDRQSAALVETRNEVTQVRSQLEGLNKALVDISTKVEYNSRQVIEIRERLAEVETYINKSYVNGSSSERHIGMPIAVVGEIHTLVTIPEVRYPYNAVLTIGGQTVGVYTTQRYREGAKVVVIGYLAKGYVEQLTERGWQKTKEVHYIHALEIKEITQ
ncbi:MAG: hypothetical protein ACK4SY_09295 [Pyrobaculum sp.]